MFKKFSILLLLAVLLIPAGTFAQKLFTRDARVQFDATSANSPEQVEATNKSGTMVLDLANGRIQSAVLMTGFVFEKALMQEHFNENYVESSKYPKSTFNGKLDDMTKVNFKKDGTYKASVSGDLTIKGIKKSVKTPVTFTIKSGQIAATTDFTVKLADYKISVPSVVSDKLGTQAKISIKADLKPFKR